MFWVLPCFSAQWAHRSYVARHPGIAFLERLFGRKGQVCAKHLCPKGVHAWSCPGLDASCPEELGYIEGMGMPSLRGRCPRTRRKEGGTVLLFPKLSAPCSITNAACSLLATGNQGYRFPAACLKPCALFLTALGGTRSREVFLFWVPPPLQLQRVRLRARCTYGSEGCCSRASSRAPTCSHVMGLLFA